MALKVISNKEPSHPNAKLVLGAPRRNAKHQLGEMIVRDFVRKALSIALLLNPFVVLLPISRRQFDQLIPQLG